MDIYERLVEKMKDEDTDYAGIFISEGGVDVYTSLDFEDLQALLMEIIMLEKYNSILH